MFKIGINTEKHIGNWPNKSFSNIFFSDKLKEMILNLDDLTCFKCTLFKYVIRDICGKCEIKYACV